MADPAAAKPETQLEFRILKGEEELVPWLDLCDACFRSSREYFESHYTLDPDRDHTLIFIALDGDKIVGSVRVFPRYISLPGVGPQRIAGIGEVCTLTSHRGKGISSKLMNMAREESVKRGFSFSTLKSSAAGASMYRKLGYETIDLAVAYETWQRSALDEAAISWQHPVKTLEERDFSPTGSAAFVPSLYAKCISSFAGPFIRSDEYWATWVAKQDKEAHSAKLAVASESEDGSVKAWLLVGFPKKGDVPDELKATPHSVRFKVMDFLCDPPEQSRAALGALTAAAAQVVDSFDSVEARGGLLAGQYGAVPAMDSPTAGSSPGPKSEAEPAEPDGSVLLCCMSAAMMPPPAEGAAGIARAEHIDDSTMYSRLTCTDQIWEAVKAITKETHAFCCADDY